MKTTVRTIGVVLALLLFLMCFTSCNNSNSKKESGNSKTITNSTQAINAVKNHLEGTPYSIKHMIAAKLGFSRFSDPNFASSTATQNSDGSWSVTLKGNMMGTIDEYGTDLEANKFEVNAKVSETGKVEYSVKNLY